MNSHDLWVVIFRGIPRAGKTTLAKTLHHRLEDKYKIALIHYDTIFEMKTGKDKESLKPKIALGMIENFLIENYNLILDNSFIFTQYLRQTIQFIEKYTLKYRVYFLKPSFLEIVERDKKFPVPKGIEALKEFWITMENNDFPEHIEIDTDTLSIDESVEFILRDIQRNILLKAELGAVI